MFTDKCKVLNTHGIKPYILMSITEIFSHFIEKSAYLIHGFATSKSNDVTEGVPRHTWCKQFRFVRKI